MKLSKKTSGLLIILILFSALFMGAEIVKAAIAAQTLDQNCPTFESFNATKGYYLAGKDVTPILQYPEQTVSYIILKDGSNTYAKNGHTGVIQFSGTNSSDIMCQAIAALPGAGHAGEILAKSGAYNLTGSITLGKNTRFMGEGRNATVFDVIADKNCFVIDSSNIEATWGIEDLTIDMNYHNGQAIYSAHAGQTGHQGHPTLKNIRIQEIASGYCGIYLIDGFMILGSNIEIRDNHGTGMKFGVDETKVTHFGNSHFSQIYIGVNAVNAVGLDIVGGATYRAFNLAQFDRLQVGGTGTSYDGTIGIRITNDNDILFNAVDLEGSATQVYLDKATEISFVNPFIWSTYDAAGYYGVRLVNACRMFKCFGGILSTGVGAQAYSDESTGTATIRHSLHGTKIYGGWTLSNLTDPSDAYWWDNTLDYAYWKGDYQRQTGAWADPTGPIFTGRQVTVYSSTQGSYRLYTYINGAWHYDVQADDFWVHGLNCTDTVMYPEQAASYIILKDGSNTYAKNGHTGVIQFSGTNSSDIMCQAIAALPGAGKAGEIVVKDGTYTISGAVVIGEQTRLIGESAGGVVFDVSGNLSSACIYINTPTVPADGYTFFDIENIEIDMNDYNGHGIYGPHLRNAVSTSEISSLYIHNIKAGYSGIKLNDPFNIDIHSIRLRYIAGIGVNLVAVYSGLNSGNLNMWDIRVGFNGNNAVGFNFTGTSTSYINFIHASNLQVITTSSYTGTIGIYGKYLKSSTFTQSDIEMCATALSLTTGCQDNLFEGGQYNSASGPSGNDGVYIDGTTSTRNHFLSCKINADDQGYHDDGTGSSYRNTIDGCYLGGVVDVGTQTLLYNNENVVSEFSGATANVADGGAIFHGLDWTPTFVTVSGSVAGDVVSVSVLDTTHFHVDIKKSTDGTPGTTQTIYWRAVYQPNQNAGLAGGP